MNLSHLLCKICENAQSKYRCPQCSITTCSLSCINLHKTQSQCLGIRNKTEFIPIQSFRDRHLLNDFRFLEEISRNIDNSKRLSYARQLSLLHPNHIKHLIYQSKRRNLNLSILPRNFSKHKNNRSYFKFKTNLIEWTVDWIVYTKSEQINTLNPENEILRDAFMKTFEKLVEFNSLLNSDIKIYLKSETIQQQKFHELDLSKTICENLKGKEIIEYPVFYVVPVSDLDHFLNDK